MVWTALGGGPFAAVPDRRHADRDLGVLSYFLLVRHIMRGPMLAQILGTFGLALFLRYAAFWYFGANFKTLPDTLVGGRSCSAASASRRSRLLAGAVGLLDHPAAAPDPDAHRRSAAACWRCPRTRRRRSSWASGPQRMQALAWALAARATGIAGALIANFFYTSPTVGETLAIVAFVTVCVRRLRQRAGRAGRRACSSASIESLSAYLIGPVYKDVVVYILFVLVLWFRPQGLMGKA